MNGPVEASDVSPEEIVARFVRSRHWIRASDDTVKPDAFMPPSDLNLSVTRHIGLSEELLWKIGQEVVREIAEKGSAALIGRADLLVKAIPPPLKTEAAAIARNPNHAHLTGWPSDKPSQKNIAQRLAALALFLPFRE
jgi:hypothetical protein